MNFRKTVIAAVFAASVLVSAPAAPAVLEPDILTFAPDTSAFAPAVLDFKADTTLDALTRDSGEIVNYNLFFDDTSPNAGGQAPQRGRTAASPSAVRYWSAGGGLVIGGNPYRYRGSYNETLTSTDIFGDESSERQKHLIGLNSNVGFGAVFFASASFAAAKIGFLQSVDCYTGLTAELLLRYPIPFGAASIAPYVGGAFLLILSIDSAAKITGESAKVGNVDYNTAALLFGAAYDLPLNDSLFLRFDGSLGIPFKNTYYRNREESAAKAGTPPAYEFIPMFTASTSLGYKLKR